MENLDGSSRELLRLNYKRSLGSGYIDAPKVETVNLGHPAIKHPLRFLLKRAAPSRIGACNLLLQLCLLTIAAVVLPLTIHSSLPAPPVQSLSMG